MNNNQNIVKQLVRNRRKRVEATDEESLVIVQNLWKKFQGRELATALAAEGFGTLLEVGKILRRFNVNR